MEIDMHSPSFRGPRSSSYSMKRARSPDSPSQERQSKRPTLAITNPSRSYNYGQTPFLSPPHIEGGRQPGAEDWVRQAQDLRIESPLIPDGPPLPVHEIEQLRMDENMSLDSDIAMSTWKDHSHTHSPPTTLGQSSSRSHMPQVSTIPPSQVNPLQTIYRPQLPHLHSAPPEAPVQSPLNLFPSPSASHSHTSITNPSIFVLPATPSDISPSHPLPYHQDQPDVQGQSVSIPPESTSSGTQVPSNFTCVSASNRKQRFTMGPRADCLKCKMSVKGHWAHLD
ncbi:hypothetical protein BJ138DRAFT_1152437 [Hygrophoropsis aurantiaca]|uniref:Uncharacterized protein n=1 Tax=Hygrophoropsis aurantiaca TaxID=72124 RepID=A0ACB8ABF9_9AGAM|nr:hypothetical protein BJ138DRAFT_1152437 [Hygrophoropsis aurantiaca]